MWERISNSIKGQILKFQEYKPSLQTILNLKPGNWIYQIEELGQPTFNLPAKEANPSDNGLTDRNVFYR